MEKLSISAIAGLTGKTREQVNKRLEGLTPENGERGAKLYRSDVALERLYLGSLDGDDGPAITEAESRRRLNVKREAEIDLNMEIKRKERIPLPVVEEINDRVFTNMAGLLKSWEGKVLTPESVNDMLSELRTVGQGLASFKGDADV